MEAPSIGYLATNFLAVVVIDPADFSIGSFTSFGIGYSTDKVKKVGNFEAIETVVDYFA